MLYVITHNGKPLSGFHSNDLPVSKTGNFSNRTIFPFRSNDIALYGSQEEAEKHIRYIRSEILANKERYEEAAPGSTLKLLAFSNNFKVQPSNI